MKKILITGITGFVGSHLADYILGLGDRGIEIHGTRRWRSPMENIDHIADKLCLHYCEFLDSKSVYDTISGIRPDVIFHLAAQSFVPVSFDLPVNTLETNICGTVNLLEAVRHAKIDPIIHICSSSEVYGQVRGDEVPIKESQPFRPASPYAVSKVGEDMIAFQYFLSYGVKTIRTRMFTHSISKWTPVILRDSKSGLIDIRYISEIRKAHKKGGYLSGRMENDGTQIWDMSRSDLEVWNDGQWTKIKHLSCHPIRSNKLLEISCRCGVVDVTDNHSVIDDKGRAVCAGELSVNDKVKLTALPKVELTSLPYEAAWLYGFFVAEGCVTGGRMRLDNQDVLKLKKARQALLKWFAIDSDICESGNNVHRLWLRKPFRLAKRFYEECYASDKNKRVPKIVLNAEKAAKVAFLEGYNAGDGDEHNKVRSPFYRFKTKSPLLASGLCYLIESALEVKYRIHVEHRGEQRYFEIRCLSQRLTKNGKWLLKDDNSISKVTPLRYAEEVWDFETENHWFHAGIGGAIVHNTGPRRGEVFAASAFARQIARIEAGLQETVLRVGNLASVRTFADVRDTVKAYWILVQKCPPGEVYNIGGSRTMTVGDALNMLLSMSPRKAEIKVVVDKALLRPSDVTLQIPDCTKFKEATGWEPEIPVEKTFEDLLNYWRKRYGKALRP